jgi:hypothetical protein
VCVVPREDDEDKYSVLGACVRRRKGGRGGYRVSRGVKAAVYYTRADYYILRYSKEDGTVGGGIRVRLFLL